MRNRKILRHVPIVILGVTLLYVLYWRWQVSAIRFFDVDEFSYMHWAGQVAAGLRQYVDFFSYFTPGFMWVYAPIFWRYGVSAQVFTAARVVSFIIFLGILFSLGYVWGITRNWKWALLPVIILAVLPMPYDKFLEIRPDNLAILLAMAGVILEIKALRSKTTSWWLATGLAYSASLFVLTKMVPIVMVGAGIAVLHGFDDKNFLDPLLAIVQPSGKADFVKLGKRSSKILSSSPFLFLYGLVGPWILFFLGAAVTGHLATVWYSVIQLPFEVYRSVQNYPMEADLFFFPNVSFYGIGPGLTTSLIVNHAIWVLAIGTGTLRFVTPFREGNREKALTELLLGGIFFISIFGYVKFFPLKHIQYLIPIAVMVAYYAADGFSVLFDWVSRIGGYESLAILLFGFAYLLGSVTHEVNAPKLLAANAGQLSDLSTLIQTIPLKDNVVDLEGRMVFWPDGYPVSSLPIDSTLSYVTRRPPPLYAYLPTHPADYVWDGDSGRLEQLIPENVAYIKANFSPVAGWGERLWKRK